MKQVLGGCAITLGGAFALAVLTALIYRPNSILGAGFMAALFLVFYVITAAFGYGIGLGVGTLIGRRR